MKRFIIYIFFFVFICLNSSALLIGSVKVNKNFNYSNLNFSICTNHGYASEITILKFKGLSNLLNKYLLSMVKQKKLENKKFEIEIGCKTFGGLPEISVSQNENGYFVFIHYYPDLEFILKIVNYFASPQWESFVPDIRKRYEALKTFKKRIEPIDISAAKKFFSGKKVKVWSSNDIDIYYRDEDLKIYIVGKKIDYKIDRPLPIQIKNRYIISVNKKIIVLENSKIIASQSIPKDIQTDVTLECFLKSYPKWVNLYQRKTPILSYSYNKNKFFVLIKRHPHDL